jgi:hypothetical protein
LAIFALERAVRRRGVVVCDCPRQCAEPRRAERTECPERVKCFERDQCASPAGNQRRSSGASQSDLIGGLDGFDRFEGYLGRFLGDFVHVGCFGGYFGR